MLLTFTNSLPTNFMLMIKNITLILKVRKSNTKEKIKFHYQSLNVEKSTISFFLDGCIQTKVNICSCPECLKVKFAKCSFEAGKAYFTECSDNEFSDLNSDEEIENDDLCCENENVTEEN